MPQNDFALIYVEELSMCGKRHVHVPKLQLREDVFGKHALDKNGENFRWTFFVILDWSMRLLCEKNDVRAVSNALNEMKNEIVLRSYSKIELWDHELLNFLLMFLLTLIDSVLDQFFILIFFLFFDIFAVELSYRELGNSLGLSLHYFVCFAQKTRQILENIMTCHDHNDAFH